MLRCSCFVSLVALALFPLTTSSGQTYAFQTDEAIFVADLEQPEAPAKKLTGGYDPAISPDGKAVAFTQQDEDGNRRIAIVDVETAKVRLVAGIPGENAFLPAWSIDGKQLYFHHFGTSNWRLARVDAEGGGFTIILEEGGREAGAYGPFPNGNGWLCHDLDSFFVLKAGEIFEVPNSTNVTGLSLPSRLSVAPDCQRALFEIFVEEDMGPDDEGPPAAISLIDLTTGKRTQITARGINGMYPNWLPGGEEFLFAGYDVKTNQSSIYRMKLEPGAKPVLVRKNASWPSVATGTRSSR